MYEMSDEEECMCSVSKHPTMAYVLRHRGTCEQGCKKPKCGHKDKNREFQVHYKATSVNSVKDLRVAKNAKPKWVSRKGLTPQVYTAYGAWNAVEANEASSSSSSSGSSDWPESDDAKDADGYFGGPVTPPVNSLPLDEDCKFKIGDRVFSNNGNNYYKWPGTAESVEYGIKCDRMYRVLFHDGTVGAGMEEIFMTKEEAKVTGRTSVTENGKRKRTKHDFTSRTQESKDRSYVLKAENLKSKKQEAAAIEAARLAARTWWQVLRDEADARQAQKAADKEKQAKIDAARLKRSQKDKEMRALKRQEKLQAAAQKAEEDGVGSDNDSDLDGLVEAQMDVEGEPVAAAPAKAVKKVTVSQLIARLEARDLLTATAPAEQKQPAKQKQPPTVVHNFQKLSKQEKADAKEKQNRKNAIEHRIWVNGMVNNFCNPQKKVASYAVLEREGNQRFGQPAVQMPQPVPMTPAVPVLLEVEMPPPAPRAPPNNWIPPGSDVFWVPPVPMVPMPPPTVSNYSFSPGPGGVWQRVDDEDVPDNEGIVVSTRSVANVHRSIDVEVDDVDVSETQAVIDAFARHEGAKRKNDFSFGSDDEDYEAGMNLW